MKNKLRKKIIKRIFLTLFFMLTTLILVSSFYIYMNLRTLPKVDSQYLQTYEPTKIVDKNNNIIWEPTDKHVEVLKYNEIPSLYKDTLIAVEDKTYWTNHGYSMMGVGNMILTTIASKLTSKVEARGGSTLEQQLIKNVYFNGGYGIKTITRKIQEIYLARQINHNFSKKEILTFYVNHLSFAEGDTGIGAAMKTYFGKDKSQYKDKTIPNIAEQAYLAGLGQNPTRYNLYTNPKAGNERKNVVLSVMLENKLITKSEYEDAKNYDVSKSLKPRYWESEQQRQLNLKYTSYTDEVLKRVKLMGYNINDVSFTIHTYLDPSIYDKITDMSREDKYYQDGKGGTEEIGVTVINKDGIVLGMVGSRYENNEVNRATQRTRSSGSSTKPFTAYGPLLQYMGDTYNTASSFSSAPYKYPGTNIYMNNWGNYTYGNVSIQRALRLSLNTVVGRIDDQILGSNRMKTFLNGLSLDTKDTYSSIDGIGLYISTLDAAAAWNALNNGGIYIEPRFIDYIEFSDGSKKEMPVEKQRAMNESTAWVLTQMLRGVVTPGYTGASAAITNKDYTGYAGKTGTVGLDASSPSPNVYGAGGSDSWFNSITNEGYSVSIWTGYDKPNESPQVADSFKGPQLLGKDLQLYLNGNKSIPNWNKPKNVVDLGGTGIESNYGISDSRDITQYTDTTTLNISPNYKALDGIKDIKTSNKVDINWAKHLSGKEASAYSLYETNPDIVSNPLIINDELYKLIEKGGN